jgi:hypothetical protein
MPLPSAEKKEYYVVANIPNSLSLHAFLKVNKLFKKLTIIAIAQNVFLLLLDKVSLLKRFV